MRYIKVYIVGRDSSVGIATRYRLDGLGIESRWGRDFQHPSRPALGATQPPIQWAPGLSQGLKRPGRGADHPPPCKGRGQERVGLYLYSPSEPSWPVTGRTFTSYYGRLHDDFGVTGEGKFCKEACRGSRGLAPLICNFGTRWRWVISLTSQLRCSWEKILK